MPDRIVESDVTLHIGAALDKDRHFLWSFVFDGCKVCCRGPFQNQWINLLKTQTAVPHLFLIVPDGVVAQVENASDRCLASGYSRSLARKGPEGLGSEPKRQVISG
jgi:hypothetical protein